MKIIKSPLRYPGGKSRGLAEIARRLPPSFCEFREPMTGGGSVFIFMRQRFPDAKVWINDLNFDVYCFWREAQRNIERLAAQIRETKAQETDGRVLFEKLKALNCETLSDFERAARFFILNRITFSGTIDAGGYSQKAFEGRFTDSSIQRLAELKPILEGVRITHEDYSALLHAEGEGVFLFLDPPYLTATRSRLYGRKGAFHTGFDHARFGEEMRVCKHQWMITYDDAPELRARFAWANQHAWKLQYGMNNYKQEKAEAGAELIIANYSLRRAAPNPPPLALDL